MRKSVATSPLPAQSNRNWPADTWPILLPFWCPPKEYVSTKAFIDQKFILAKQLFTISSQFSLISSSWQSTFKRSSRNTTRSIKRRKLTVLSLPLLERWLTSETSSSISLPVGSLGIWWYTKKFYMKTSLHFMQWNYLPENIYFYLCIVSFHTKM